MGKILALWATPRSTSTAFEWAMANRGDMTCLHEPYNEAYYYGEDRRHDRYFIADASLEPTAGLTIRGVHDRLRAEAAKGPVFVKDFGYSIAHMADNAFLDDFTHSFLIRDPEKVLTSMHARWPDIILPEIGFEELHTLFRRVADRTGQAPAVIDSDELLANPEGGMRAYCAAVGIDFIPEALDWEAKTKARKENAVTWNKDEHGFHDALKASKSLAPQKREYPPLDSNADMLRLYKASLPHYRALFAERLRIPPAPLGGLAATA